MKSDSYFLIHQVRYAFILRQVKKIADGKRLMVLDVGCYPYHIGEALEKMGHTVFGISSFHEPIKRKNIAILNVERDAFPYKNESFDLILFNEVLEHLPQSSVHALREMKRVLKGNGILMITTPNIARSINRAKLFFGYSIMYPIEVFFENEGKGNNIYHRHNREYTLGELCALLAQDHWRIVKKEQCISYTPFRKRLDRVEPLWLRGIKILNYLLMLVVPSFRDTLFVLAKKNN